MDYWNKDLIELTPKQFELEVKTILEGANAKLAAFEVKHQEKIHGAGGAYKIDVTARFEALGGKIIVLIECKHQKSPIKREIVQILHDKLHETGSHKGMIFATTPFQRGAIDYASAHGIALVILAEGKAFYKTKGLGHPDEPPPWANIPPYMGCLVSLTHSGNIHCSIISVVHPDALNDFLEFRSCNEK